MKNLIPIHFVYNTTTFQLKKKLLIDLKNDK